MSGATSVVRGACHHDCPDTCAWEVTVRNGVAVSLRGDPLVGSPAFHDTLVEVMRWPTAAERRPASNGASS